MNFLILRFSSIGDIVLCTPIFRCIKQKYPNAVIHFATKKKFATIVENNPYIDELKLLDNSFSEFYSGIKDFNYDYVIDLHNNIRTTRIKGLFFLKKTRSYTFRKINTIKLLAVLFKRKSVLPKMHVVERYFKPLKNIDVFYDGQGLDYFIPDQVRKNIQNTIVVTTSTFVAIALGGTYATKKMPKEKWLELLNGIGVPCVLLGGPEEMAMADWILKNTFNQKIYNYCGKLNLNESAAILEFSSGVITHDTGLMHIAAALNKNIISIWGNTIPEFGMYPLLPFNSNAMNQIVEVENLSCRPCSKLGYTSCPKKHFHCMQQIDLKFIEMNIHSILK